MISRPRLLLLGFAALSACGYEAGSLLPYEGRTLAVPIFQNDTFRRGLEFDLTRRVIEELKVRSEYTLSAVAGAELILRGRIVDFQERVLSEDEQDRVQESSVLVTVEIVLESDQGEVLARFVQRNAAAFSVDLGENRETATERMFADLAERIVDRLERDF